MGCVQNQATKHSTPVNSGRGCFRDIMGLVTSIRIQGEALRGGGSPGGAWVLLGGPGPHVPRWQEHFFW